MWFKCDNTDFATVSSAGFGGVFRVDEALNFYLNDCDATDLSASTKGRFLYSTNTQAGDIAITLSSNEVDCDSVNAFDFDATKTLVDAGTQD
jgi:hypothetical protein